MMLEPLVLPCFAYLLGSISSAVLLSKIMGFEDPRTQGSHNPGATNVLRIAGRKAAFFTLTGDFLKGLIPVLAGHLLQIEPLVLALAGFAAFIGHCYPLFFRFAGGKGVATAMGATLAFSGIAGASLIATWLLIARLFKISSLAAIVSFAMLPLVIFWLTRDLRIASVFVVMSALLIWRHRSNIQRLIRGAES